MKPDQKRIDEYINRAQEMVQRAKLVNSGQYAHGIISTINKIEFYIRKGGIETYPQLNLLHEWTMQLGGYLYSLREGILK